MPRRPRDISPGFHHIWVNATGHWDYFLDDVDRITWIRLVVSTTSEMSWKCVAFCQMSTHVHVLLDVPDPSLAIGMRELNREYSCAFNLRHGREGTFVKKRFGSRRVENGNDLLATYAYVVLNPTREGLCVRPEEWRWSSYRTTIGVASDFPFVDATSAIAEAGGNSADLRRAVESAARARLKQTRPEPGSGRVLRS
jgi:REP element-mobilizing transposase RayT